MKGEGSVPCPWKPECHEEEETHSVHAANLEGLWGHSQAEHVEQNYGTPHTSSGDKHQQSSTSSFPSQPNPNRVARFLTWARNRRLDHVLSDGQRHSLNGLKIKSNTTSRLLQTRP